jgi:hypothetical protein
MSSVNVTQLATSTGSGTVVVPTGAVLNAPGRVLQVQQGIFGGTFSTAIGPNFTKVVGLSCDITPRFATSRVMVTLSLCYSQSYWQTRVRLLRNNSVVTGALGDANGVRERVWLNSIYYDAPSGPNQYMLAYMNGVYLDAPNSTSTLTYEIDIGGWSTGHTVYVNRSQAYQNATDYDATPISTLTLMEIAQ